jgi:segregation and condensation protein A
MPDITTGKFSGPLELLLSLIEKEEMDITEIALAKIADEYILYIKSHPIGPEAIADFLVVAAKLLYIKSKALLPYLSTPEEDEEIAELEKQLKMYKEFLDAAKGIEKMLQKKKFSFQKDLGKSGRKRRLFMWQKFSPPKNITADILREKFDFIISALTETIQEFREEMLERKINIEERIIMIQKTLIDRIQFKFSEIVSSSKNKTEVIVSFLALLELAKQRELYFEQSELFSDITINKLA